MSDDDVRKSPQGGGRGWYGSIESINRESSGVSQSSPVVIEDDDVPRKFSNIHTNNEYMDLDEPEILDEKKALYEEFERKRRARLIHVTTDDVEV